MFYYLIDLHYSQTFSALRRLFSPFYYLIDLHYSQTIVSTVNILPRFYYLIDLHYSQTHKVVIIRYAVFYYLIDLHYSQTAHEGDAIRCETLHTNADFALEFSSSSQVIRSVCGAYSASVSLC